MSVECSLPPDTEKLEIFPFELAVNPRPPGVGGGGGGGGVSSGPMAVGGVGVNGSQRSSQSLGGSAPR